MGWDIDPRFDTPQNAAVLQFLRDTQPSAHSDVAEELTRAAAGLSGVRWYCPDTRRYAFVLLHDADLRIFGLAWGMSALAFRLPEDQVDAALADRGRVTTTPAAGWVRFEPFTADERLERSRQRLARWCRVAASHP